MRQPPWWGGVPLDLPSSLHVARAHPTRTHARGKKARTGEGARPLPRVGEARTHAQGKALRPKVRLGERARAGDACQLEGLERVGKHARRGARARGEARGARARA